MTIWTASRLVTGPSSDGGKARVPDLCIKDPRTKKVTATAKDNKDKSDMFFKAFFPAKPTEQEPIDEDQYPPPRWDFQPVTDEQIHRIIKKFKPYKASRPGTIPNSVFKECKDFMVPFMGPLYRATDSLKYYPDRWKITETPILRKPGKPDYSAPSAWRPIVLSDGMARILNAIKTEDIVNQVERLRLIPKNHFGG
ncbi:hypothetical protein BD779DRAFT_1451406, partial [Infundibulicybe gibba]